MALGSDHLLPGGGPAAFLLPNTAGAGVGPVLVPFSVPSHFRCSAVSEGRDFLHCLSKSSLYTSKRGSSEENDPERSQTSSGPSENPCVYPFIALPLRESLRWV